MKIVTMGVFDSKAESSTQLAHTNSTVLFAEVGKEKHIQRGGENYGLPLHPTTPLYTSTSLSRRIERHVEENPGWPGKPSEKPKIVGFSTQVRRLSYMP